MKLKKRELIRQLMVQLESLGSAHAHIANLVSGSGIADYYENDDYGPLAGELDAIQDSIRQLGTNVDSNVTAINAYRQDVRKYEERVDTLEKRIVDLSSKVKYQSSLPEDEYTKAQKTISRQNEQIAQLQAQHNTDVRTLYDIQMENRFNSVKFEAMEDFLKKKGLLEEFKDWLSRSSFQHALDILQKTGVDIRKVSHL